MARSKKKKQVCESMREFEEKYFPKSFRKQSTEVSTDARAIGISLARESLDTIRHKISK